VLREDVDAAFARGGQVAEGVFGVGEAAGEADGEEGGVVVYYLRVGEGGEVGCRACGLGEGGGLVGCGGDWVWWRLGGVGCRADNEKGGE